MFFAGFDEWIPIFKGGRQTDSQGNPQDGDALIENALRNFNPAIHEPPVCIGHPKDDKPAFGWVSALTRRGNTLYAMFKDVVPEFVEMVKNGLFKKRSAGFYPDGTLRHVAFLGANPPAVKGLPDMSFAQSENFYRFDFSENTGKTAGETLHEKTLNLLKSDFSEKQENGQNPMTYRDALLNIIRDNPGLARVYEQEIRP
jgi:hypothetical protein